MVEHPREARPVKAKDCAAVDGAEKPKAVDAREKCAHCGKKNHTQDNCWKYMEENNVELTAEQKERREAIMAARVDGDGEKRKKQKKRKSVEGEEGGAASAEKKQKVDPDERVRHGPPPSRILLLLLYSLYRS